MLRGVVCCNTSPAAPPPHAARRPRAAGFAVADSPPPKRRRELVKERKKARTGIVVGFAAFGLLAVRTPCFLLSALSCAARAAARRSPAVVLRQARREACS